MPKQTIRDIDLSNKRVLVRVDFNVPLERQDGRIVITDDMVMLQNSGRADLADPAANAVRAVAAGNTMLLYVGGVDMPLVVGAIQQAVLDGTIDESLIDDAAHRLLVLRRTLSGETGRFVHCFEACQSMIE